MEAKKVILSGMQPTGQLHLGNLEGALKNWVSLQDQYRMFCCIVDWHALTSDFEDTEGIKERTIQVAIDYLAAGLDPEKCSIFIQSNIKEHAELHLLFSMITPRSWLERVPTYKDKAEELDSYGFLGYPLLQAADILIYRAHAVPVGEDQLPHIELTREVCRRFNHLYGKTFPEPQGLLTRYPAVPGTDGRKMSKSYGNDILIADTPEVTAKKIMKMFTDPLKLRKGDPGRPEICPVYALHKIYTPDHEDIVEPCRSGRLGCVEDKKRLIANMNEALAPIRQKRRELEQNEGYILEVLHEGARRARQRAAGVMGDVRKAMNIDW